MDTTKDNEPELDQAVSELVEKIGPMVKQLDELALQAFPGLKADAALIIDSKSLDKQRIERVLDRMLDLAFHPDVLEEFRTLCRYYYAIDPEATASYVYAYRDMWDEGGTQEM